MRRIHKCAAGTALALLLLAACADKNAGGDPGGGAGPKAAALTQSGRWLVDSQGRAVILHGVNFLSKLPPYLPSALGFGADDARYLASQGFNTIRTGIAHKGFATAPGQYDMAYLEDFARSVKVMGDAGLHVMIDFHQDMYNERYQGNGMADWATFDSSPTEPTNFPNCATGFPGNMFVCEFVWEAFDRFFGIGSASAPQASPREGFTLQQEYAEAWGLVAARFKDDPMVFSYDIFNEPHPGSQVGACLNPAGCPAAGGADAALTEFHTLVAAAIRAADPDTIVYYEPFGTNFNAGMPTAHGDIGTTQVGFSFHVYGCPSSLVPFVLPAEFTEHCGPLAEENVYVNANEQADAFGHSPLVTEFGATDDLATIDRVIDLAAEHRMGWQYWAWWNEDPCCERPAEGIIDHPSNPPTTEHLDEPKLDVLVRPFPRAVAGTPTAWNWDDAAKRFTLSYTTQPVAGALAAGAVTEIWVPKRHFPDGYTVSDLAGAEVVSAAGAEALQLRALPGATEVSLAIAAP